MKALKCCHFFFIIKHNPQPAFMFACALELSVVVVIMRNGNGQRFRLLCSGSICSVRLLLFCDQPGLMLVGSHCCCCWGYMGGCVMGFVCPHLSFGFLLITLMTAGVCCYFCFCCWLWHCCHLLIPNPQTHTHSECHLSHPSDLPTQCSGTTEALTE